MKKLLVILVSFLINMGENGNILIPASTGHNTDDKYSALVEPNLWYNNIFQPNVTYTAKYQMGAASQILVHKPGVATITSTAPGADFNDSIVQDSLVTISLNKQFNRSRKIYGATAATVAYPIAAAELETATREIAKAWTLEGYQALAKDTSVSVSDTVATAVSDTTVYDQIVSDRQKLVEAGVTPDVIIVSPKVYGYLLKSPEFQRTGTIGDQAIAGGNVGQVAGMTVVEYQAVDSGIADGSTISGGTGSDITWASGDEMEYVMYDHDTFSIVSSVNMVRVKDSENFNGTKAQIEMVSGFKVTNPARVLLKYHDASAA